MKKNIFLLLSIAFLSVFYSLSLYARQELIVNDINGAPLFLFDIADGAGEDYADGKNPQGNDFFWTLVPQHIEAIKNA
jgi:hypothetical protein